MNDTWTDEEATKREAEETVRKWFAEARAHDWGCGINLYYSPNADVWGRLVKPFVVRGVDTGMIEFEGGLFQTRSGSGDCEMNLYFIGQMGKE